ncbi:MAG: hypothetical protein Q8M27_04185 [Methylotenera sp.]|nr:hypothetical protein [Methylotenera sp.]
MKLTYVAVALAFSSATAFAEDAAITIKNSRSLWHYATAWHWLAIK